MLNIRYRSVSLLFAILCLSHAGEGSTFFTNFASFSAATAGLTTTTLDFDGVPAGTLFPGGSSLQGVTFSYSLALGLAAVNTYDTTSGSNSLGLDDPANFNQFVAGDSFTLSFAPARAIGMYFITTADPIFAGDIRLEAPGVVATNAGTPNLVLGDGGTVYFVGLLGDADFSNVHVGFDPGAAGAFLFNVDDISVAAVPQNAVPEPGLVWLTAAAGD